ncbi:HNH endonuclease signature motif containing protein [Brachybacterium sp. AOP35-5H-19]|uniref:HNH endonuclease signature motif containing protein n=1 Tax=Brachybacterium sp. AOP35-5H-19 TaxID=3457685 RepID=UPI0040348DC7
MTALERFFSKLTASPSGCWEWTATRDRYGYGKFWDGSRKVKAHRWAYEHLVGPIPSGLVIDHKCRNRSCVNPAHMETVTNAENLRRRRPDMDEVCANGHPRTAESTYMAKGKYRNCRVCSSPAFRSSKSRKAVAHV